jgi:hypothetical protein
LLEDGGLLVNLPSVNSSLRLLVEDKCQKPENGKG